MPAGDGRWFREPCAADDLVRAALAIVVDTSISGARVVRQPERPAVGQRLRALIVSDEGTGPASGASLRWAGAGHCPGRFP
ncbi:MAG: hypothetical protein K2X74_17290 [Acetobacteraceae bacterium]|nr:hypothetical protein [Acetobacteraceae bacterium]